MRLHSAWFLISLVGLTACSYQQHNHAALTQLPNLNDRRSGSVALSDEAIEIKAREDLNNDPLIPFQSHINVNAYNGTLLVTGEAPYEQLHELIIEKLRILKGVKRVQDEITIASPSHPASQNADSIMTNRIRTELDKIQEPLGFKSSNIRVVTENSCVYLLGLVYPDEADIVTSIAQKAPDVSKVVKLFEYLE